MHTFLIADDHSIVRNALRYILQDSFAGLECLEAANFEDTQKMVRTSNLGINLVVLDLNMPGLSDVSLVRKLVELAAPSPVVVFSMMESTKTIRTAMELGVKAFIPKSIDDAQIAAIVKLVLSGGTYVPPVLSGLAAVPVAPTLTFAPKIEDHWIWPKLTRRQREVLIELGRGKTNSEIADSLNLTLSTVKTHVSGILKVMEVENRTQAILLVKDYFG